MAEGKIKDQVISGAVWTGAERVVRQVVQFVFGIILARLIGPSDYGIVGLVSIFIVIANTFVDSGMGLALIQQQERTENDFSTVFLFNLIVSVIFYFILFFSSPFIASFYNIQSLELILRVLAVTLVINALSAIGNTRMTIDLRFKELSIISIVSTLVTGFVGLLFAYSGFGVWALVFQTLASSVVNVVLVYYYTRWRPTAGFSKQSFKKLFGFGSKVLGTSLIFTVYSQAYTLVIGKAFSPTQVGYYNRGNQYSMLPQQTISDLVNKLLFPVLSRFQDDIPQLLKVYKKMTGVSIYLLYPMLIGLAVMAGPLVELMIGEEWLPCAPFIQILCLGNIFGILSDLNLKLLLARGRSDLVLKLDLIKKPIGFTILFLTIPLGITWMIVFKSIYEIIAFLFNCYYTKIILNYGAIKQIKDIFPIFIKACIMGGVVYLSILFLDNNTMKVFVGIFVGVFIYLFLSLVSKDSNYYELLNIVKSKIKK